MYLNFPKNISSTISEATILLPIIILTGEIFSCICMSMCVCDKRRPLFRWTSNNRTVSMAYSRRARVFSLQFRYPRVLAIFRECVLKFLSFFRWKIRSINDLCCPNLGTLFRNQLNRGHFLRHFEADDLFSRQTWLG